LASKVEVIKLMALFEIAFPRNELKQGADELYWRMLKDLDVDALAAAADQLIATRAFYPAIGEWRQAALDIILARLLTPSAQEAWEEVQQACARIGHRKVPTFSHPLIEKTVNSMGWANICLSEEPDWQRNYFIKAYEIYLKRADEDARMLPSVRQVTDKYALEAGKNPQQAMTLLARRMEK
jgi:hypothetical protein